MVSQVTRRSVHLAVVGGLLGVILPVGGAAAFKLPPPPQGRANLKERLAAGERRRAELDALKGPVRDTPSGIQYRELEVGFGLEADRDDICDISYTVYTQVQRSLAG